MPTIAAQSAEQTANAAAHLPPEVMEVFIAEAATLEATGVPDGVISAGSALPDADLLDVYGAPTTLSAARADAPAVVVLYRGAWCPYCNVALHTYQADLVPALLERGVRLLAVSPQAPDGTLSMTEKHELTFAVLSDRGNQLATALGVLSRVSDGVRGAQAKLGLDVAAGNADGTDDVPMPTVVVVDASGTIRWIDVHPDYRTRSEVPDILAAVDAMS
jgi:peroxiredoxin